MTALVANWREISLRMFKNKNKNPNWLKKRDAIHNLQAQTNAFFTDFNQWPSDNSKCPFHVMALINEWILFSSCISNDLDLIDRLIELFVWQSKESAKKVCKTRFLDFGTTFKEIILRLLFRCFFQFRIT